MAFALSIAYIAHRCHPFIERESIDSDKLIIGWQCRQEMVKIPSFTDIERLKTPKTDCVLKVYKDKEFYQLGLQVC